MDSPMFSRKRPLLLEHDGLLPLRRRKCLMDWPDPEAHQDQLMTSSCYTWLREAWVNRWRNNHLNAGKRLLELTLLWADTKSSVQKVLERVKSKQGDIFLDDSVNGKFLAFRRDIAEEYGAEDKQHSWAVLEKREEVVMYGPYYPNYGSGEHSEDVVIKQTQQLLEAEDFPENRTLYVFTVNSPCLARNSEPCMLNLVHKAREWWRTYAVKTHIGFVRSWGFKGNKENLFKDVDYRQVTAITQSVDYESYVDLVGKIDDLSPLCETVFSLAKDLLSAERLRFPLTAAEEKQDQKSCFKSMNGILESKPEEEKKLLTKELSALAEAADLLLSGGSQSFEEHVERGTAFSLGYAFSSEVCEGLREEMRVGFQRCWRETVQDRCAEFVREKLTDEFNKRTVQLFIDDVRGLTRAYLQIGKVKLQKTNSL
ncbi:uncharacterized protein LOC105929542 [Fundulus heteroclitus]|uniref:uncharacterized protein LOC105929542 n=1 Tax=Fundulus heteroclitus TaxID=8078 RepID=UPI00165BCA1A|nr:uncharacterized protein LOC105929542 [Fundulus heteroclitus]